MEPFEDNLIVVGALAGAVVGGTAVHYFKKQQEEQSQQLTHQEESRRSVPTLPSPPIQTPLVKTPTVPRITKQCLLLVISATQAEFLNSLQAKGRIDMSDGERLYEITKYLWLGYEPDFHPREAASIRQYSVSEGKESEYDIYLVSFKLDQPGEGFSPNVNQLDRYDAFRNLADLAAEFSISPRLKMEAYGNFDVYNR